MVVCNKSTEEISRITNVYGSSYEEGKHEFISELHNLFLNWTGPAIVGGDFNLVRNQNDKTMAK